MEEKRVFGEIMIVIKTKVDEFYEKYGELMKQSEELMKSRNEAFSKTSKEFAEVVKLLNEKYGEIFIKNAEQVKKFNEVYKKIYFDLIPKIDLSQSPIIKAAKELQEKSKLLNEAIKKALEGE